MASYGFLMVLVEYCLLLFVLWLLISLFFPRLCLLWLLCWRWRTQQGRGRRWLECLFFNLSPSIPFLSDRHGTHVANSVPQSSLFPRLFCFCLPSSFSTNHFPLTGLFSWSYTVCRYDSNFHFSFPFLALLFPSFGISTLFYHFPFNVHTWHRKPRTNTDDISQRNAKNFPSISTSPCTPVKHSSSSNQFTRCWRLPKL